MTPDFVLNFKRKDVSYLFNPYGKDMFCFDWKIKETRQNPSLCDRENGE